MSQPYKIIGYSASDESALASLIETTSNQLAEDDYELDEINFQSTYVEGFDDDFYKTKNKPFIQHSAIVTFKITKI